MKWICLLLLLAQTTLAWGLTESEAVGLALRLPIMERQLAARHSLALARVEAAGRWANPELEYTRESVDFPSGSLDEDSYLIRQRINLAGVKALERSAARWELGAEESRIELTRREWVAEIRQVFYTVLLHEQRQRVVGLWRDRLAELADAVAAQARAGDLSHYDRLRVVREQSRLQALELEVEAALQTARDSLSALLDTKLSNVTGTLWPPAPPTKPMLQLAEHPVLLALDAEIESATANAKAAGRAKWPELTLGLGHKEVTEPDVRGDGLVISLGVELPLFDRGRGREAMAAHRRHVLETERVLMSRRLEVDAKGVLQRWRSSLEAFELCERDAFEPLADMAEAAYRGGEIGMMEMMDAWRGERELRLEMLDHAHRARQAWIEWQLLTGESP
ncbi:MAG: hypothetical protein CME38_18160 [Haliea sp.]|nr:hypothetical protein [Haliea sp.]